MSRTVTDRDISCLKRCLFKNLGRISKAFFEDVGVENFSKTSRNKVTGRKETSRERADI